ncbi:MAG TPA: SDR family NAD(P)-dependent oxidoreductase [Nitrososphaera sp.]|jgi:NAD(P)-dependent dehydrogenase (short-subunit alcohol dehydrogenase family)|nr:SDR family NAD(P)-dependent oxidoreductase [Nitrososphaera sp.]
MPRCATLASATQYSLLPIEGLLIQVVQLDVTDENSIKNAVQSILSEAGRIDLPVNNAGMG